MIRDLLPGHGSEEIEESRPRWGHAGPGIIEGDRDTSRNIFQICLTFRAVIVLPLEANPAGSNRPPREWIKLMSSLTHYSTIQEIEADHRSTGGHFFDRAALRFFNSRIGSAVYGGRFFITSEQFDRDLSPRLYTIRECRNGRIEDLGDFQQYATGAAARAAIRKHLEKLSEEVAA